MTQTEVMKKAALLLDQWRPGDIFQCRADKDNVWIDTDYFLKAIERIELGYEVQIKPKPVRRLKPIDDIIQKAYDDQRIELIVTSGATNVNGVDLHEIIRGCWGTEPIASDWPDSWFTTETPTPPADRIAEMAESVVEAYYSTYSDESPKDQLERLIREECGKRGIT